MPFAVNDRIRVNYSSSEYHDMRGYVLSYEGPNLVEVQLDNLGKRPVVLPESMLEANTSNPPYVIGDHPHDHKVACQLAIGQCAHPAEGAEEEDAAPSSSASLSSAAGSDSL